MRAQVSWLGHVAIRPSGFGQLLLGIKQQVETAIPQEL